MTAAVSRPKVVATIGAFDGVHLGHRALLSHVVDRARELEATSWCVTFDPHPDLVLTARINSLHEHYRPQIWTKLPYAGTIAPVLDLNTHVSSGEADLTVFLLTSSGNLVGAYRGSSSFNERFNTTGEMSPGTRLNHALSEAVQEIQGQILADARLRTVAAR